MAPALSEGRGMGELEAQDAEMVAAASSDHGLTARAGWFSADQNFLPCCQTHAEVVAAPVSELDVPWMVGQSASEAGPQGARVALAPPVCPQVVFADFAVGGRPGLSPRARGTDRGAD